MLTEHMMTVVLALVLVGFICTIINAIGKCPLWIGVFILYVIELLRVLPLK
jgi:hypothetical protein